MELPPMLIGALATFHPGKGRGWTESVLAVMIVGTTLYVSVTHPEVPDLLVGAFGVVSGYFFGRHITENAPRSRK